MQDSAFLVLEDGMTFPGRWKGGQETAGEVVFNTSHSGYEEMATDPSYFSQILVTTAPMQGNYGEDTGVWESSSLWIRGFVSLQIQDSPRDRTWLMKLIEHGIPVLTEVDTRALVLYLRERGTLWGAVVRGADANNATHRAKRLIEASRSIDRDWAYQTSVKSVQDFCGHRPSGPRVAVIDFGCKRNIVRQVLAESSEVRVFPSRATAEEIKLWNPHGIVLSNGPGDPKDVQVATETLRELLGWRPIFGICMGHQLLARALGAETYRLKFGHRGSNHPIRDDLLGRVYMTSQNHGYAVDPDTLPVGVRVCHWNLNDNTVAGLIFEEKKCLSVQFHPESCPGPHDSQSLFSYFFRLLQ